METLLENLKSELEAASPIMDDYDGGYVDGLIHAITQIEIVLNRQPTITITQK